MFRKREKGPHRNCGPFDKKWSFFAMDNGMIRLIIFGELLRILVKAGKDLVFLQKAGDKGGKIFHDTVIRYTEN
jgi:hypothetical protein